jgi:hypothetical protein
VIFSQILAKDGRRRLCRAIIDFSNQQVMQWVEGLLASLDVKDRFLTLCVASATVPPRLDPENSSLCSELIPIDSADIQHCEHTVQEEVADWLHRWLEKL